MTDRIIMENLLFFGYHGVLAEETALGQRFSVSLAIETDFGRAAHTDDLKDTINYADIYTAVKKIMEGPPHQLLETLAEKIADPILAMGANTVHVTVKKLHPPIPGVMDFVAVEIERRRKDGLCLPGSGQ